MRAYIKKLQSKSEIVRKQILIGSLIVCMAFVGLIWIGSLSSMFGHNKVAKEENTTKPFALLEQSISNTYNNITASVGNISSTIKKEQPKTPKKQIDLIPVETQ
jgi:hypothetical protein